MINTENQFNNTIKTLNEMESLLPIMEQIDVIVKWFINKEFDKITGDEISRAIVKLSALRVRLGVKMAEAGALYDLAYINRKFRYYSEWKPTKDKLVEKIGKATVQDIESEVQLQMIKEIMDEQSKKHIAETMKVYHDTSGTLVTSLQSRLKVLMAERREIYE